MIRQRYEMSELPETFGIFTFNGDGYAVLLTAFTSYVIEQPYYKFHKGGWQRCYADTTDLQRFLRIEDNKIKYQDGWKVK